MPTPSERKALLFLAAVVSLGAGVRAVRAVSRDRPADPVAAAALTEQLRRVDSARSAGKSASGRRRGAARRQPATPADPVDLDTASADAIEALNGIGPSLAARIVAHRDSFGPFGSLERLREVRGVGPALSAKLAPQVTFSLVPRPKNAVSAPSSASRKAPERARRARGFP
jgi:competence protein ComEA